jgi:hypothetical protein
MQPASHFLVLVSGQERRAVVHLLGPSALTRAQSPKGSRSDTSGIAHKAPPRYPPISPGFVAYMKKAYPRDIGAMVA